MFFVLLGAALGIAIGFGKIPALEGLSSAMAEGATSLGYDALDAAINATGMQDSTAAVVVRTVSVALMPGIVAGVLLGCARSGVVLRRFGALLTIVAAVWVFFTQDMPYAAVGSIVLLSIGLMFAFLVGTSLSIVSATLAGVIATAQIRLALSGNSERFTEAAGVLLEKAKVGDLGLWVQVLAWSSAILPVVVLWSALRD
jgi:hypothetical protein